MGHTCSRVLDYDFCRSQAAKVNYRSALFRLDEPVYTKSVKMGWLDGFAREFNYMSRADATKATRLKNRVGPKGYVTRSDEEITEIARRYTTLIDFRQKEPDVYRVAGKHGLLKTFTWLKRVPDWFTFDGDFIYAYEFPEYNRAYIGRSIDIERRHEEHCRHEDDSVYEFADEMGIDIPEPKIIHRVESWSKGKKMEAETMAEYEKNGWVLLNRAAAGSIGRLGSGISLGAIVRAAMEYEYLAYFKRDHPDMVGALYRHKWFAHVPWLKFKTTRYGTWKVYENVEAEARKFNTLKDFKEKSPSAYAASKRYNWLSKFTWLNKGVGGIPMRRVNQYDGNTLLNTFNSLSEASDATGIDTRNICTACRKNITSSTVTYTSGGFVWRYAD